MVPQFKSLGVENPIHVRTYNCTNILLHVIFSNHTLKWVLRIFQLSLLQGRFVQKRTFTFKNGS